MVEVQDIFLKYANIYRTNHKLTLVQHKAMSAIQKCRTSQLGGHKEVCAVAGIFGFPTILAVIGIAPNAKLLPKNVGLK